MEDTYVELSQSVVVQRSHLAAMSSDQMNDLVALISIKSKKMKIVESVRQYFSHTNLIRALDVGDVDAVIHIAEYREVAISEEQLAVMSAYAELKAAMSEAMASNFPPYTFASVPTGWAVDTNLSVTSRGVCRTTDRSYKVGVKTLERVWNVANLVWSGETGVKSVGEINASGYTRDAIVLDQGVKIGCQEIRRYELEQLALSLGWTFPGAKGAV